VEEWHQILPISATIVGLNEGHYLNNVFSKLSFFDEIFYFDLGSTDNSREIANEWGVTLTQHEKLMAANRYMKNSRQKLNTNGF